jgi:hypothetical protein
MSEAHLGEGALEALAAGEPADAAAHEHAGGCLRCGGEVALRRRERRALALYADAHEGPEVDRLWSGLEARLPAGPIAPARGPPGRAVSAAGALAALACAGAAFAWLGWPRPAPLPVALAAEAPLDSSDDPGDLTPSARAALDRAELEYRRAADVLESEARLRAGGRVSREAALAHARAALATAHADGSEPRARLRLLGGYSAYLKSLRRELDGPPFEAEGP